MNVSLPKHLHAVLLPLLSEPFDSEPPSPPSESQNNSEGLSKHLTESSQFGLSKYVKSTLEDSATELPADVLRAVSRWAQTDVGKAFISSQNLDPTDYLLISLLAGTKTSPSSNPPPSPPSAASLAETEAKQRTRDRKTITALVNALFSVFGVGAAAWWAAESVGWRAESKVALALFAGAVVAISEGVLYLIYSDRREKREKKERERKVWKARKTRDRVSVIAEGDGDDEQEVIEEGGGVRKRRGARSQNRDDDEPGEVRENPIPADVNAVTSTTSTTVSISKKDV